MSYKNLQIWQDSRELSIAIHKMSLTLPQFEQMEEGRQIRRSSKSVRSNIVEGYCRRRYKMDFVKFIVYAIGSCDETIDHLDILQETGSLTDDGVYTELIKGYTDLSKKLVRFLQSVEKNHNAHFPGWSNKAISPPILFLIARIRCPGSSICHPVSTIRHLLSRISYPVSPIPHLLSAIPYLCPMSLVEEVNNGIKEAMKARDEARLRALRNIKSAFLLLATAEGGAEVTDEACIKALQKLAKQRKDSIDIFRQQNRNDLADKEQEELSVIEAFLPTQMGEAEVVAKVSAIIAAAGASGMKDLGKVMPVAMKELSGQADGKLISETVKKLLQGG